MHALTTDLEGNNTREHISISALKKYVSELVFKLTAGKQQPVSRNENVILDWDIW